VAGSRRELRHDVQLYDTIKEPTLAFAPFSASLVPMHRSSRLTALLLGLLMTLRLASPAGGTCGSHAVEHCAAAGSHEMSCHATESISSQPADQSHGGFGAGSCQMMASCSTSLFSVSAAPPASSGLVVALTPEIPVAALHSLTVSPESPPPKA
jgi:hypothetical protein